MALIVGRDEELAVLDSFFERPLPTALLIDGEAGIGKTIVWQEGIQRAETRGYRVLRASPSANSGFPPDVSWIRCRVGRRNE